MISSVFVAFVLCLVTVNTQHAPGVPPKQQGHHGGGHGHEGKPLEFASEVHNADHILEHLEKVVATKSKEEMTEEELEFHYFKLHDYDNNNKLDGVEIGKALTHFHEEQKETDTETNDAQGTPVKVMGDEELAAVIDNILEAYDFNKDGIVDYLEFKKHQQIQKAKEKDSH